MEMLEVHRMRINCEENENYENVWE